MPQIPAYDQRIQPLDGASAVMSQPGVKTWEVKNDLISGWVGINETWAYASATTITVPATATDRYQKGDKVRLKQGGAYKYFNVVTVAATLLTVSGGTDYTVANAAISDVYVSRAEMPFGWPDYFNYTPVVSSSAGTITAYTIVTGKFKCSGTRAKVDITVTVTNNGTGSGSVNVTIPFGTVLGPAVGSGSNPDSTKQLQMSAGTGATTLAVNNYDGTYPVATGQSMRLSAGYEY